MGRGEGSGGAGGVAGDLVGFRGGGWGRDAGRGGDIVKGGRCGA